MLATRSRINLRWRAPGPGRGADWQIGHQRQFGPFTAAELPPSYVWTDDHYAFAHSAMS